MTRLLSIILVSLFAITNVTVATAADKKAPVVKKAVKKHKKAEPIGKVADDKPSKVAKKK